MTSTRRQRLADLFPGANRRTTTTVNGMGLKHSTIRIDVTATTADVAIFAARGDCAVLGVYFVPEVAVTADGANKWVIAVTNRGTDGLGTTQFGTSFDTSTTALVKHDLATLANPAAETIALNGTVFSLDATETGAVTLRGLIIVEYESLVS